MSKSSRSSKKSKASSEEVGNKWPTYRILHTLFALFLLYWYRSHLSDLWVASVDLPGHITVIQRLVEHLGTFSIRFFDPHWFSGWPAFQFYAPLSHLFAALISLPLSLVSQHPARLSAHLMLLGAIVSIAPLIHLFARSLLLSFESKEIKIDKAIELPLAICSIALSFWFLNHDRQWYGIGAAAALHVGLFSQAIAWPILLYYLSQLNNLASRDKKPQLRRAQIRGTLGFTALFLTHSLTAAFALFVAIVFFALYSSKRRALILLHLNAFLLCGFWLIPFIAYSSMYTGLDIYRPKGDFLEIILRYPLLGLFETARSALAGESIALEITNIFVLFLVVVAFLWNALHKSKVFITYGVVVLLGCLVFSSGYVASSIPIGLHYYRFFAYLFLLLTAQLACIPVLFYLRTKYQRFALTIIAVCSIASLSSNFYFPHYEYKRIAGLRGEEQFVEENQVLAYLRREPDVGRVFFSYFSNYEIYPFLSAHFFTSQLWKRNSQETLNGLFIQSALAYRMPVASAVLLGIPSYHIPLLFTDGAELSTDEAFKQLLDSGVTHVVLGKKDLREALSSRAIGRVHFAGPYAIVRIAAKVLPKVTKVNKPVVGYLDIDGSIPFNLFEMYFYSRASLYSQFELVQLEEGAKLPPGVSALVVNGMSADGRIKAWLSLPKELPPVVRISHKTNYSLNHYKVWYQHNVELDSFKSMEKTLDNKINLVSRLLSLPRKNSREESSSDAKLVLASNNQEMLLEGLDPNSLYKINYSYFPYWNSLDASVYRGMPERIFVTSRSSSAKLSYALFSKRSTWIGYFCSAIGLFCLLGLSRSKK